MYKKWIAAVVLAALGSLAAAAQDAKTNVA